MAPMINMLSLLNDLQQNEWHITAFQFTYKNTHYIVLFEDISNLPLVNGEYIAFLTFIDKSNENRIFQTKANEFKFSAKAKEFREYFNIEYANNLGDIFKQFYSYFGGFIPTLRVKNFDNQTQQAIINQLSRNDHESVNNLCCYAQNVMENMMEYNTIEPHLIVIKQNYLEAHCLINLEKMIIQ